MKFEERKVYTHQNMLDVVMRVMYVFHVFDEYTKLRVKWYTRSGIDMNVEETVKVQHKDFDKWYEWKGKAV